MTRRKFASKFKTKVVLENASFLYWGTAGLLLNSSWVNVWNREWRLLWSDEVIFWLRSHSYGNEKWQNQDTKCAGKTLTQDEFAMLNVALKLLTTKRLP